MTKLSVSHRVSDITDPIIGHMGSKKPSSRKTKSCHKCYTTVSGDTTVKEQEKIFRSKYNKKTNYSLQDLARKQHKNLNRSFRAKVICIRQFQNSFFYYAFFCSLFFLQKKITEGHKSVGQIKPRIKYRWNKIIDLSNTNMVSHYF